MMPLEDDVPIQTLCPHCRHVGRSRRRHIGSLGTCRKCRSKFTISESRLRDCRECGERIPIESTTCPKCGHDPRRETVAALSSLADLAAPVKGDPAAPVKGEEQRGGDPGPEGPSLPYATPLQAAASRTKLPPYVFVLMLSWLLEGAGAVLIVLGLLTFVAGVLGLAVGLGLGDAALSVSAGLGFGSTALGAIAAGVVSVGAGQLYRCIRDIAINTAHLRER